MLFMMRQILPSFHAVVQMVWQMSDDEDPLPSIKKQLHAMAMLRRVAYSEDF